MINIVLNDFIIIILKSSYSYVIISIKKTQNKEIKKYPTKTENKKLSKNTKDKRNLFNDYLKTKKIGVLNKLQEKLILPLRYEKTENIKKK